MSGRLLPDGPLVPDHPRLALPLKALRIDKCRGHRLVSRREMLQNMQT